MVHPTSPVISCTYAFIACAYWVCVCMCPVSGWACVCACGMRECARACVIVSGAETDQCTKLPYELQKLSPYK